MYSRMRPAAAVCAALLAFPLLAACGGGSETEDQPPTTTTAAAQIEPVNMVIQMTGVLLLVPDKQSGGPTQVILPVMSDDHRAYIAFTQKKPTTQTCEVPDAKRDICYTSLDGWSLEGIGIATAGTSRLPRGAVNLSRGSVGTVDTVQARSKIRSQLTLLSGSATDSCGLATWTFDPVGNLPPEKIRLINVLEWQIPNLTSESLELVLHRRGSGSPEIKRLTLHANDAREIELLIFHLPLKDANTLTGLSLPIGPVASRAPTPAAAHAPGRHSIRSAALRKHMNAFYDVMGVPSAGTRRIPTRPAVVQRVCPITILDLNPEDDGGMGLAGRRTGVSTFSCVMASADPS
jgi:hypothetical protein